MSPHLPLAPDRPSSDPVVLFALARGDRDLPRLRALLHGIARVEPVRDRQAVASAVARYRPLAVVLPPTDERGEPAWPLVAGLGTRGCTSDVVVLADALPQRPAAGRAVLDAARAGARVLTRATEEAWARELAHRTLGDRATPAWVTDSALARLAGLAPPMLRRVLERCVTSGAERLTVASLAASEGVSVRALQRALEGARWPAPSLLLVVGRLLLADAWRAHGASAALAATHAGWREADAAARAARRIVAAARGDASLQALLDVLALAPDRGA